MQDFMQHHTYAALFTKVSGVVGGVGKAISAKPLLLAITLSGLSTVIIYAAASAAAGGLLYGLLPHCKDFKNGREI
jgi:hypothetical protein